MEIRGHQQAGGCLVETLRAGCGSGVDERNGARGAHVSREFFALWLAPSQLVLLDDLEVSDESIIGATAAPNCSLRDGDLLIRFNFLPTFPALCALGHILLIVASCFFVSGLKHIKPVLQSSSNTLNTGPLSAPSS